VTLFYDFQFGLRKRNQGGLRWQSHFFFQVQITREETSGGYFGMLKFQLYKDINCEVRHPILGHVFDLCQAYFLVIRPKTQGGKTSSFSLKLAVFSKNSFKNFVQPQAIC